MSFNEFTRFCNYCNLLLLLLHFCSVTYSICSHIPSHELTRCDEFSLNEELQLLIKTYWLYSHVAFYHSSYLLQRQQQSERLSEFPLRRSGPSSVAVQQRELISVKSQTVSCDLQAAEGQMFVVSMRSCCWSWRVHRGRLGSLRRVCRSFLRLVLSFHFTLEMVTGCGKLLQLSSSEKDKSISFVKVTCTTSEGSEHRDQTRLFQVTKWKGKCTNFFFFCFSLLCHH